jgi:hypothetical protein
MNRTTTVVVALIAAAGLSTMVYAVPEQRALAWFGGFGGFGGCGGWGGCGFGWGGCGFGWGGCGGGFFVHKTIIQTINQVNHCTGDGQDQNGQALAMQGQGQQGKVVCLNTATNTAGNGFGEGGGLR